MRTFRSVVLVGLFGAVLLGVPTPPEAGAVVWSVAIQASTDQAPVGQAITVTVSTNYSLQNTGYELRVMLDGWEYASCTSTPCRTPIIYTYASSHSVRGELWGRDPNCGRSSVCQTVRIQSSSTATISWVADAEGGTTGGGSTGGGTTGGDTTGGGTGGTTAGPTASGTSADGSWTVLLSASFAEAVVGESVTLSSSLNRPLGDSGLSIRIIDAQTGAILADCSSGSRCQTTTASQEPVSSAFLAEIVRPNGTAVVRSDALVISWVTAIVAPVDPVAPVAASSGGFPTGVILFVIAAAVIVGGLVAWAFRAPR